MGLKPEMVFRATDAANKGVIKVTDLANFLRDVLSKLFTIQEWMRGFLAVF